MVYLLDTCVISEFTKKRPEPRVISWLNEVDEESTYLSALTVGEIQRGISRLPKSDRRTVLNEWLGTTIDRYDERILSVDTAVMRRWGKLTGRLESKGRVLPVVDSMIAATALEHALSLVTRNEEDFFATGVPVLNIWS